MPNKLTAMRVKNMKQRGMRSDGGGLYIRVSPTGTKSWIFRFRDRATRKLRDMGLGPVRDVSLKEARDAAAEARKLLRAGLDPIAERKRQRDARVAASANAITFREAAAKYIEAHSPGWKNQKHLQQWRNTIEHYASVHFGNVPVRNISDSDVFCALDEIWLTKPETASRVRGRIEKVLDWSIAREYRDGPNPARWRGHLATQLPATAKIKKVRHHPALPYSELHGFMSQLKQRQGVAARCLEFVILTAARTGEAVAAEWSEFDLSAAVWVVPGQRMKAKVDEHRVPLPDAAIKVLENQRGIDDTYVFPGQRAGRHLSNMALLKTLREMGRNDVTVHGFRSSFRDWAAECTNFSRDVVETSLAHTLRDKVEAAYFRSDLLRKRAALMDQWAKHCRTAPPKGGVTNIGKAANVG